MNTVLRAPKIYGFMRGFQRWVLVAEVSAGLVSIACIVTTGAAIGNSFPVVPLEGWNRACGDPACGTGMCAFHVTLAHKTKPAGRPCASAPLAVTPEKIQS